MVPSPRQLPQLTAPVSAVLFLADKRTPVTEHPPYLLDLAPRGFFRFPEIKSIYINRNPFSMRGRGENTETAKLLKALSLDQLQHYFE